MTSITASRPTESTSSSAAPAGSSTRCRRRRFPMPRCSGVSPESATASATSIASRCRNWGFESATSHPEPSRACGRSSHTGWRPIPTGSMSAPEKYDAIVIGAGQAGVPLSTALAKAGRRTALIEREHVGGTCINEGCTPTKTMVASARVAYLARRGGGLRGRDRAGAGGPGPGARAQAQHRGELPRRQPAADRGHRRAGPDLRRSAVHGAPHRGGERAELSRPIWSSSTPAAGPPPRTFRASTGSARSTRPRSWSWTRSPST